jgi:glycosyltransferase involved in cell wall biosynthesis
VFHAVSTVIIPYYGHADFVATTFESVALQDYRPLELVVVDDASADATPGLLPHLVRQLPPDIHVCLLRRRHNHGQSSAINLAVGAARGDVYTVLNSDDYLTSDAVRLAREIMLREQVHLFGAKCELFSDDVPTPLPYGRLSDDILVDRHTPVTLYDRLPSFNVTHTGTTFSRAGFDAVRGYRPWRRGRVFHSADRDFQLRLATLAASAIAPQDTLSLWRQGSSVDAGVFS